MSRSVEIVVETRRTIEVERGTSLELIKSPIRAVHIADSGPQGPAGANGTDGASDQTFEVTTGEAISALRCVKVVGGVALRADSATVGDAALILGITTTAAGLGSPITVRTDGQLTDAVWSWSPGPIYCGAIGVLTQTPPATGFVCEVARAKTATTIVVDVQTPFIRG